VRQPASGAAFDLGSPKHAARRVVMVTSPGLETSLNDVVINLATICSEIGQRVGIIGTAGLEVPEVESQLPLPTPLWGNGWGPSGHEIESNGASREQLVRGSLDPADVEERLGETGVPGVFRLDIRYFVEHPTQVVVRAPAVVAALEQIVDVVFLEIPSYLSVHHGEGLTPLADVVLVVAERRETTVPDIKKVKDALKRLGAPVVGMALTRSGEEGYIWGFSSELPEDMEEFEDDPAGEDPPTEQLPSLVSEPSGFEPAVPLVDRAVNDGGPPED
jgi:hypothetical protein